MIAIDLGDKRTGLAVGDTVTGIVSPAGLIELPREREGGRALAHAVATAVEGLAGAEDVVVLGLPLNMDGTEGPRAKVTKAFALHLAAQLGRPVRLFDERRSSMAADERLNRSGLTHLQKKRRRDALAAAAICAEFLAAEADAGPADDARLVVRPPDGARTYKGVDGVGPAADGSAAGASPDLNW